MSSETDILLEPCDAYEKVYKASIKNNGEKLFDSLLEKSGINSDENRKTAEEYRRADHESAGLKKRLSKRRVARALLIILAAAGAALAFYEVKYNIYITVIAGVVALAALVIIFTVLNKQIKSLKASFNTANEKAIGLYNKAMGQMAALLDLFESTMATDLIKQTVPALEIDKNYDMRRFDLLQGKYGYPEEDGPESSMIGIMSGEIIGNPFVFERKLSHRWGSQRYHGTLTIHWTTTRFENGKPVTEHHSETLHATVEKPKPFFNEFTDLVYGNEAAPDLTFSRSMTHAEDLSERKLKSTVKSKTKKIKKLAKENMDKGFTELGNEEFDALWGATNRDHEVQFRLLFTPLAQKNLLRIIKGESPYGDDFNFIKNHCINIVSSEHAQIRRFTMDVKDYYSYDVDICRSNFVGANAEYFKSVFFDFAPLLSIPLYQQMKPREYIYKDYYNRNYTVREAEVVANRLGRHLAHPASVTPAILKTRLLESEGDVDRLMVSSLSYRTVRRVDYIPVHGGDGRWHNVPVPWLLYVPLEQNTKVELKSLDMGEHQYSHSEYARDDDAHTFHHSIFATLGEIESSMDSAPDEKDMDISGLDIDETD